jgi:hypothetical protein
MSETKAFPTIPLCACESSRIAAHGYSPETKTLALQFRGKGKGGLGATYHYSGVSPEFYEELKGAESLGKFFGARVSAKNEDGTLVYPFTRVAEPPADEEGDQ